VIEAILIISILNLALQLVAELQRREALRLAREPLRESSEEAS